MTFDDLTPNEQMKHLQDKEQATKHAVDMWRMDPVAAEAVMRMLLEQLEQQYLGYQCHSHEFAYLIVWLGCQSIVDADQERAEVDRLLDEGISDETYGESS